MTSDQWIARCYWHTVCQVFWWVSRSEERSWSKLQGLSESPRRGETGARRCGGGEVKRATQGLGRLCGCLKRRVGRGRWPWRNNFLEFQIVERIGFGYICCTIFERSPSSTNFCALVNLDIWLEHISTKSNFRSQERVYSGFFDSSLARNRTWTKNWTGPPPPTCLVKAFESRVSVNYRNQLQLFSRRGQSEPRVPAVVKLWSGGDLDLDQRCKVGSGDIPNSSYTEQFQILWSLPVKRLHERIWVKWVSQIGTSGREVTDKLGILTLGVEQLSKYFTPSSNRVTLATIGVKQLQMLYSLSVWRLPWRELATISYVQLYTNLCINTSHRYPIFFMLIIQCHLSILYQHLQIVNP